MVVDIKEIVADVVAAVAVGEVGQVDVVEAVGKVIGVVLMKGNNV